MFNNNQKISIVIPVFNEEESLPHLEKEITEVLDKFIDNYEIIFINDGSVDKTTEVLERLAQQDSRIKVIEFNRNFGQTAALAAGIDLASGEIIITLDADLENDSQDIPKLLEKFNDGFDIVSGWRQQRWLAKRFTRRFTSKMANWLISLVTKTKLHDYGCTLKVYRASILKKVRLYGEMHRFIPAIAAWQGAKIAELPVNYRPRKFGRTKYGLARMPKVLLDLLTVKFLSNYATKPMHFFGKIGYYLLFLSFLSGLSAIILKIFRGSSFISTPLPLLTAFLALVGVQFILMGLLAEMMVRTYYESQQKQIYSIKKKINF